MCQRVAMLSRPMLAASYRDGDELSFPLLATPKIDGVRALIVGGKLVSRSFRSIPNATIRQALEAVLPEGADGEISCGTLYDTTSTVMSKDAGATGVTFSWFDWAYDLGAPYSERASAIREHTHNLQYPNQVVPLIPNRVNNMRDLELYEATMVALGHEGIVVRAPQGRYKCGRSTMKEGLMIKIKRNADHEAVIVGTEELMHNMNDEQADNFGKIKRSLAKQYLVPGDTLGAIVAECDGGTFKIGTGFTANQRNALWANRDIVVGKLAKYKCTGWGNKGMPMSPVFMGIRHPDDT